MANKLTDYKLNSEYPDRGSKICDLNRKGKPLLQKNYGKGMDCTLTSLAFIFGEEHYSLIEKIAERYFYDGDRSGTMPVFIKAIMRKIMKALHIKGRARSRYFKGVGFTYETVKNVLNAGNDLLLNLWKDGRDYYKNHTVTIIGYAEYERARFLVVYDNWNACQCLIDYDKLSFISSINWYEVEK